MKETRAEALRTTTVTGQRLLQESEAVSDDDDDDDDDGDDDGNDTVLGETRNEKSESEEIECEEGDESEFEPLAKRPCSTRSGRHQEPITRSLQLSYIPVTAFSQTDLFLV